MTTTPASPPSSAPFTQRLAAAWQRQRGWLWTDVLAVFLLTRLALIGIALLARTFPNADYPIAAAAERGWQFTPVRLLDVWGRWDSGWYFDIIENGYLARGDIRTVQSNLGFFPLYPYLVKALAALVPAGLDRATVIMACGVLMSNLLLIGGLALTRQWVATLTGDEGTARRAVLYLLLFPTGFFFSAFYTESTFLCCAAAALLAAQRRAWFWAAVAGALLTLSRPLGILIGVPLAWQYAEAAGWNPRRLRWDALWFLLLPAAFLAFCYYEYTRTGDFLATLHHHQAWARGFAWPWQTLLHPLGMIPYITPLEQALTVVFGAAALWALVKLPSPAFGLWALLLIAPPLFTGQLTSTSRYYAVVLPAFVALAQWGRRPLFDLALTTLMPMTQALLFFLWCLFYWVA
ncbi:MAG: hypothetical protein IT317_20365 [Anaerolineales bacterium]|nr:hypothetical protein [Anaerolineales bacterium]